ncbi:ABC transporter substrate-binding protein [Mucilaginibacter sp. HMF5004]|uniref:ABC transporter substrate-binding protein n=1 Tax=Mucilaginibacter rivuli TaxID=2857527 RepID=UPI001C5FEE7C|nr:ABC transporter substrate-binding protein [Mucilaginibacter rivuli]MBW4889830.1 ABC transporter substrate-binding protein [Mucilaginibacter rivuli]
MDKITIGLLLPSSTIFPIAKEFEKGLKEGLKPLSANNIEVDIIKEFIGQGDFKLVEKGCNKFYDYDEVDLVTGFVSNNVARDLAEKIKTHKKPFVVNNMGDHVPGAPALNEYIYLNGPHLWQHAYTLGHWGVSTFGKKGMYISSVYDAGYGFSQMFHVGMMTADASAEWSFSVPPMPLPGELSNMDVIFPFLEQYQPDFIFATFCGAETTLFLNELIARGWHKKTKILGLPYLLAPFAPLNDDITVYTTQLFTPAVEPAKLFYHLGLQTGQSIAGAAATAGNLQAELLKLNAIFNIAGHFTGDEKLTILKHDIKAGEAAITTIPVTQWETFGLDPEKIAPLTAGASAGWTNPYLAI